MLRNGSHEMIKYCLPILETTDIEIYKIIDNNLDSYEYFEIWIDYVESYEIKLVLNLLKKYDKKLIFVTRRQLLQPIKLELESRYELINTISESNAFLDLDITTQALELDYIKHHDLKPRLILSYHNYELTPSSNDMAEIITAMKKINPSIYKLATYCLDNETALRLLQLLISLRNNNKKVIIIGMGEAGKITRLCGALWGNEINFAPLSINNASAPGQLTRQQYNILIEELGI